MPTELLHQLRPDIQVNALTFNTDGYEITNGAGGTITLSGSVAPTISGAGSALISANIDGSSGLNDNNTGVITLNANDVNTLKSVAQGLQVRMTGGRLPRPPNASRGRAQE